MSSRRNQIRNEELERHCRSLRNKQDAFIEDRPSLNTFLRTSSQVSVISQGLKHLMDTTTSDTKYDKLLFMYQYLKTIEPYIVNAAKNNPDEGSKYLKEYITNLKEIQDTMAEEINYMKSIVQDETKGNRKEILKQAREVIKTELGGLVYFLNDPIEILPEKMFPEAEPTVELLVQEHAGGGKHHFHRKAGEHAANTARRRFNSAKLAKNRASTVKRRDAHLFSLFLKDRREALKGLRLDAICKLRELSGGLAKNEEFIKKIRAKNGNLSLRKAARVFSKDMGLALNEGPLDLGDDEDYEDVEFPESGPSFLGILLALIALFTGLTQGVDVRPLQQNAAAGVFNGGKRRASEGGGTLLKALLPLAVISSGAQSTGQVTTLRPVSLSGQLGLSPAHVAQTTVGPRSIFVRGAEGSQVVQVSNIGYYTEKMEERFLPAVGGATDHSAEVKFLSGLEDVYSGAKAQHDLGLARNVVGLGDISQVNLFNSLVSWTSTQLGVEESVPEGRALVNFVDKKLPELKSGISNLMNNPESAGIIPISELASLKTLLQTSQFKSKGIKFYEDKDDEDIITKMRSNYLHNKGKNSLDNIRIFSGDQIDTIFQDIADGKHSIGSVAVITKSTPLSDKIRMFYGAKTVASDLSIEPTKVIISVITPINYKANEAAVKTAEEEYQKGLDAVTQHDERFNKYGEELHELAEQVKQLENEVENIRKGVSVVKREERFEHSTLSATLSLVEGVGTWAISGFNPRPTKLIVEDVKGEPQEGKTQREKRYTEKFDSFLQKNAELNTKINGQKGLIAKRERMVTRNNELNDQLIKASNSMATNLFTEYGMIELDRTNFDKMAPLVRKFLNKDHDVAIDYALKSCKHLQPQLNPLVSGLFLYTENGPTSSGILYPESINSTEIRRAVTGIQKLQTTIYKNILQKCMIESEYAVSYYSGINKEEMIQSAKASGYDSTQIAVVGGALDLSKQLAPKFALAVMNGKGATGKEEVGKILKDIMIDLDSSIFNENAKANLAKMTEDLLGRTVRTSINVVNTTITNLADIYTVGFQIIADIPRMIHRNLGIGLIITASFTSLSIDSLRYLGPPGLFISVPTGLASGALAGIALGVTSEHIGSNSLVLKKGFDLIIYSLAAYSILRKLLPKGEVQKDLGKISTISEWSVLNMRPIWERRLNAICNNINLLVKADTRWFKRFRISEEEYKIRLVKVINETRDAAASHFKTHMNLFDDLNGPNRELKGEEYNKHLHAIRKIILLHCLFNKFRNQHDKMAQINGGIIETGWDNLYTLLEGNSEILKRSSKPHEYTCDTAQVQPGAAGVGLVAQQPQAAVQQPQAAVQQPQAAVQQPQAAVQQPQAAVQQPQAAVQQPQALAIQQPQAVQPHGPLSVTTVASSTTEYEGTPPTRQHSPVANEGGRRIKYTRRKRKYKKRY